MKNKQYCSVCDSVSTNKEIESSGGNCPRCSSPNNMLIPVDDASLKHTAAVTRYALELEGKILVARQFGKWVGFQQQLDTGFQPTKEVLTTWLDDNGYWTGTDSVIDPNYLDSIWSLYEEQGVIATKTAMEQDDVYGLGFETGIDVAEAVIDEKPSLDNDAWTAMALDSEESTRSFNPVNYTGEQESFSDKYEQGVADGIYSIVYGKKL